MEKANKRRSRVLGWTALAVCLCLLPDGGELVPRAEDSGDQFELLVSDFRSPIRGNHFSAG